MEDKAFETAVISLLDFWLTKCEEAEINASYRIRRDYRHRPEIVSNIKADVQGLTVEGVHKRRWKWSTLDIVLQILTPRWTSIGCLLMQ